MPSLPEDGDGEAPHPDEASSNSRPGLPVTQGDFPIAQSPEPDTPGEQAAPGSDSVILMPPLTIKAKVSEDVFFAVPKGQSFPDIPLLGDESVEDFMTLLAGKVKARVITQEMQRKYAKQIRRAKLEELKCFLDNGASRPLDKHTLKFGLGVLITLRAVGFLTLRLIKMVTSPNSRLDGSVGVFRISMDGSNKLTLPPLRGMA